MLLAYAESTDGSTWTKPTIGTVELDGSKDNNIVYGLNVARGRSVNSACVFRDPTGGPNDRYKLLYRDPQDDVPHLYGAVSPDGLHWETLDEPLIPNYFSDTHNVVGYDPRRGQYVAYVRGWTGSSAAPSTAAAPSPMPLRTASTPGRGLRPCTRPTPSTARTPTSTPTPTPPGPAPTPT